MVYIPLSYRNIKSPGFWRSIESTLGALYPELGPDAQKEIQAQYMIDYYAMPVTLPDFAFPDAKIAIYCDGYEFHSEREAFQKDRHQSRELQLQGWCVLRFAGREILNETDAVVRTIEQAIRRKARGREDQEKQLRMRELRQTLPIGGAFAAGLVAEVIWTVTHKQRSGNALPPVPQPSRPAVPFRSRQSDLSP